MSATHLLHVTGKGIGRENGLQPMPVTLIGRRGEAGYLLPAIEVAKATVRRCLPLAGEPEYGGSHRPNGFILNVPGVAGAPSPVLKLRVRFYLTEVK